jgi:predicted transcriptional regulator
MTEKASTLQQPVISIRISDALRSRLDKLREIMALSSYLSLPETTVWS